jgi:RNA polymerase sigma factor (sigma-70 family)
MTQNAAAAPVEAARFKTTHWSVVLAARKSSSLDYKDALTTLCEAYWLPIYAYLRRHGYSTQDAEDYTQGFFTALIEKQGLRLADPEQGRFRSYLLGALKHYLADAKDRAQAQKRGGCCTIVSLDAAKGENHFNHASDNRLTPEQLFDRSWALTILHRALRRLEEESAKGGNQKVTKQLMSYLAPAGDTTSYRETAAQMNMTETAIKAGVYRLRKRYRTLLKEEIAQTVEIETQVEEEIKFLLAALSS